MDKFVVRMKPGEDVSARNPPTSKRLRQARLENLTGVVVMEDLESAKRDLTCDDASTDRMIKVPKGLKQKKPSKDVLISTGLGKIVHRLVSHENREVASEARSVYMLWKSHLLQQKNRKPLRVEYDEETVRAKRNALRLLEEALEDKHKHLAQTIEDELFRQCKSIMNVTYKRAIRKIHFTLKSDVELQAKLDCDSLPAKDFVSNTLREIKQVYKA